MKTKMLINAVDPEEYRVAFIKDGVLDGFQIETSTVEQKVGNIYKGVVERIDPRLQACFVNYGSAKNGFLSAGDIHPEYYRQDVNEQTRRLINQQQWKKLKIEDVVLSNALKGNSSYFGFRFT